MICVSSRESGIASGEWRVAGMYVNHKGELRLRNSPLGAGGALGF